jgi:hypothetical protein
LEQAARIHHELTVIHPFKNGNGRFSRLIADRYLLFWNCEYSHWPADLAGNGLSRSEYIASLKSADQGDYAPLMIFMKQYGAKDPSLSQLLGTSFYKNKLTNVQMSAMVKAFLRMGYEVNEMENNGNHPLHIAIKKGYDDIAMLLIQHKADINLRDRSGFDPFELAISMRNFKIAHILRGFGYGYKRGSVPPIKLLNCYQNLYDFDMQL